MISSSRGTCFPRLPGRRFSLDWVKTFDAGLEAMCQNQHDVVLVDYRLGARNGVELLRAALERGCQAPVILLTGAGQHQVDLEAMQAGAADYLVKVHLRADSLERSYPVRRAAQTRGRAWPPSSRRAWPLSAPRSAWR